MAKRKKASRPRKGRQYGRVQILATIARASISVHELVEEAKALRSEHGENAEYDRALVELVTFVCDCTPDDFAETAKLLGIEWPIKHKDVLAGLKAPITATAWVP